MRSQDAVENNLAKLKEMFPQCVTEVEGKDGIVREILDFEKLRYELSSITIDEDSQGTERYRFTWPDKKIASRLANTATDKTLRPDIESSVNFWDTRNLYIEGDNLDVMKILREDYLGTVKMIYVDPPYNTGKDFIYKDNFSKPRTEFEAVSGMYDEDGNQLLDPMQLNTEARGRFHTDWLNMIYPRLKLARDLLSDDGVIFISIDDNELGNLLKVCDEVFGESNFVALFTWRKRSAKNDVPFGISQDHEWIVTYAKSSSFHGAVQSSGRKYYETPDFPGRPWRYHDLTKQTTASERPKSFFTMVNPRDGKKYPANPQRTWAVTEDTFSEYLKENKIIFPGDYDFLDISGPVFRYWKSDDIKKAGDNFGKKTVSTLLPKEVGMSSDGTKEITTLFDGKVFPFPKPTSLISFLCQICNDKKALVLDFFSGSSTTAHAVLKLNAEDGGERKFIMIQFPQETDKKSDAYKAGYKNICAIGEERIRRAGQKIKNETGRENLDIGFRVLKLDSSNMKNVFYTPSEIDEGGLLEMVDNVKNDRTPLDLLFQVLPELNIELSARIDEKEIDGKKVFFVNGNYLIATFDKGVTESTVKKIACMKPQYFVMRDASAENDNVLDNFEQIFTHYSSNTVRKIL